MKPTRHTADRVAAAILTALAVIFLIQSARYGFLLGGRPGPGLFPGIIATILLAVSLLWLAAGAGPVDELPDRQFSNAESNLADGIQTVAAASHADRDQGVIEQDGLRRIVIVVLSSAVPILMLETVGYLIAMTVYVTGLLMYLGRVPFLISASGTFVGVVITAYGADALGIVLPDPFNFLGWLS